MRSTSIAAFVALVALHAAPTSAQDPISGDSRVRRVEVSRVYDSLTSLDPRERRAEYGNFAPALRAELWILHLTNFLKNRPELTVEQRSLVFEAVGLMQTRTLDLTPVDAKLDSPSNRALFDFERRAHLAFDKETYRAAFVLLGPAQIKLPDRVKMGVRSDGVDCDCNTGDDTCHPSSQGCQTWTACDWTVDGCGTFGTYWCDGLCW